MIHIIEKCPHLDLLNTRLFSLEHTIYHLLLCPYKFMYLFGGSQGSRFDDPAHIKKEGLNV